VHIKRRLERSNPRSDFEDLFRGVVSVELKRGVLRKLGNLCGKEQDKKEATCLVAYLIKRGLTARCSFEYSWSPSKGWSKIGSWLGACQIGLVPSPVRINQPDIKISIPIRCHRDDPSIGRPYRT